MFYKIIFIITVQLFCSCITVSSQTNPSAISRERCSSGLNIFSSDSNVQTFIKSIQLIPQVISIPSGSFNLLRFGNGGISWNRFSAKDNSYIIHLRFNNKLKVCCVYLNKNITNVISYEMKLVDFQNKNSNFDPSMVAFSSDESLVTNLAGNQLEAYGIEIKFTKTISNLPPTNIELNLFICSSQQDLALQNVKRSNIDPNQNSLLDGPCELDSQCERLIVGTAKCLKKKCTCMTGIALNEYQCSSKVSLNLNITYGRFNSIEGATASKPKPMTFSDINNIDCKQDRDCHALFFDFKMMCYYQRCICPIGFRLVQDINDLRVRCLKAYTSSILRSPPSCEIPFCDLQFNMFIFDSANTTMSNTTSQRLVSFNIVSDHYYYLNEYFELTIKDEKLRFFIDNTQDENARIILSEHFRNLYTSVVRQEGLTISQSREKRSSEYLKRARRYVINALATSIISRENIYDSIAVYDTEFFKYLSNYIQFSYYTLGNLTYYNIDFNINFSAAILALMQIQPSNQQLSCSARLKLSKGNFLHLNQLNSTRMALFFDTKTLFMIDGFTLCFNDKFTATIQPAVVFNSSVCRNGLLMHDSIYPLTNQTIWKNYCSCISGYMGPTCDQLDPCYGMINDTQLTNLTNNTDQIFKLATICENDGLCLPKRATPAYIIRTGLRFIPNCICKPQFSGKTCQKNLDNCTFPFLFNGRFYDRCLINSTSGEPWCAVNSRNYDTDRQSGTCQNVPCKIPFKHKSNFYFEKCLNRRFSDSKGFYEKPFCSLSRNFDLFKSWRFCELEDIQ